MVSAIERYFPDGIQYTKPEGGMFLWVTLPETLSSLKLFDMAIQDKVAFVPGQAFFIDGNGQNTLRLNYSSSGEARIDEGIRRLASSINTLLEERKNDIITVKR